MKTQSLTRSPLINPLELFANWCAGYFGADSWKKGGTLFDAEKDSADKSRRKSLISGDRPARRFGYLRPSSPLSES